MTLSTKFRQFCLGVLLFAAIAGYSFWPVPLKDIEREQPVKPTYNIPNSPSKLKKRIESESALQNDLPDKYGLLVMGDWEKRHIANFSIAYQVLLENGFSPENIYILTKVGGKGTFYHPVDDIATRESLEMILAHLANKIDENDTFFFYLNDHGSRETVIEGTYPQEVSTFYLNDEPITEIELEEHLSKIHLGKGIAIFGFCYSGGFAERIGKGRWTAISSSGAREISKSRENSSFGGYFMKGLRRKDMGEKDTNKDGLLSVLEAFEYAYQKTHYTNKGYQTPVLASEVDPSQVTLN